MSRMHRPIVMLQPTRQEKASGFLLAMLLLLGSLTLFMLTAWFTVQRRADERPVSWISLRGENQGAAGSTGASETAKTLQDQDTDDQPLPTENVAEQLTTVASLVGSEMAMLDGQSGAPKGVGIGDDLGDGRKKGRPKGDLIPPWERWQLRFSAVGLEEYSTMLDYFQVELGVAGGGGEKNDYARSLSHARPIIRQGNPAAESRLRFIFQTGELKDADRALAEKAGISTAGRVICQFYPEAVQSDLAHLERQFLGKRPLSSVRRTVFGVQKSGSGYQFFVERIEPERLSGGLSPL